MELVITVDAEEDQWGPAPSGASSVTNIEEIPTLQRLFDDYHVVPTYLLTYPVAQDEKAVAVFRGLHEAGQCEIGMHCHPWNTPPYHEVMTRHNTMLCNLPASLQLEKVQRLHHMLWRRFGQTPVAFRSGRWGFGHETAAVLARLGCHVDTSITPYTSWTASGGPDFSSYSPHTFSFSSRDPSRNDPDGDMLEIPVTIGYIGGTFSRCHAWRVKLNRPPYQRLHLAGLLSKLGVVRTVWLSPERETPARMIRLMRQSMREGCRLVNLFFHSSSLKVGCTPFVRTLGERKRFFRGLTTLLEFCREAGVSFVPLSQATRRFLRNGSEGH